MSAQRVRFGIDATPLLGRRTGIGRVVHELAGRIAAGLAEDEELVLCARVVRQNPLVGVTHAPLHAAARAPRVTLVRHILPAGLAERVGRVFPSAPLDFAAGRLDVYHGTNFVLPHSRHARGIVTIHDLSFLRFPEHVPPDFFERFKRVSQDAATRADLVIADSDFTGRDVVEYLGVPPERVTTVYPGVSDAFYAPGDRERDRAGVAERHGVRAPYVLFVGTTHPRKNLTRLLEAFGIARRRASLPHRLVLVGDAGFGHDDVRARVAQIGLADEVVLPGYVADDDLPALYRAADALAFPTIFEGFGLPVVEAFAAGCPVLTSTTSCLPEVAGDAAVLVDPDSTDAVADGLERLLTDAALRQRLAGLGRARAPQFSWDAAAARHLDLYRGLAARQHRAR